MSTNNYVLFLKFLTSLKIYTDEDEIKSKIESHPKPNSISIIVDTMNELGISNTTLQFGYENFDKIHELPQPFLGHLKTGGGEFIVVQKTKQGFVEYYSELSGNIIEDWNVFKEKWSGVALLAFPESNHYKKPFINVLRFTQILVILTGILALVFYVLQLYILRTSWLIPTILITKTFGLILSILLLQNEYSKNNSIVNRLCSVEKNDCNKVLKSGDSKFFNILSWAELGFLYFLGGILSLILSISHNFDNTIIALLLFNIPTLFFSIYSVSYQYFKAKSWCRFCLITISLFWIEAALLWSATSVFLLVNPIQELLIVGLSFALPLNVLLLVKPILKKAEEATKTKIELNRVKFDDLVVNTIFKKSELKTDVEGVALKIYGEKENTNILTIITSPTCPPCAKVHEELEKYFNGCYDDLSVNIIFTLDTEKEKDSEKFKVVRRITQIYESKGAETALEAMNVWYHDKNKAFEKWDKSFPSENLEVNDTLKKQNEWCQNNNIQYTPTIIFNGKELPKYYGIEDIKYLMT